MTRFGYHASHEQHPLSALLTLVRETEAAGFDEAMCSDHLHPWTHARGESGFAWSWLGARAVHVHDEVRHERAALDQRHADARANFDGAVAGCRPTIEGMPST